MVIKEEKLPTYGKPMNFGITHRLFLAILTASGIAVAVLVLIMQWNLSRGFLRFVTMTEKDVMARLAVSLEEGYREKRTWEFVRRDPARWRELIFAALPEAEPPHHRERQDVPGSEDDGHHERSPRPLPPAMARHFTERVFLLDGERQPLVARGPVPRIKELVPLHHEGRIVGYLGLIPPAGLADDPQKRFLMEQKTALVMVAGVIVLLSAGLSLFLAKRLVRPLGDLAQATGRLSAGDFTIRVPVHSGDEVGRLAHDFNELAQVLARNEQARRQWFADISHELRTPLAVLRGEIEALQDGIRPLDPAAINSLHMEVLRLTRLVDDLHQLAMSDLGALSYRKENVELAAILTEALDSCRHRFTSRGIAVTADISATGSNRVFGDAERLHQLFANLLDNSLKYTDEGGRLEIGLTVHGAKTVIKVQDSAPSVPETELEKLFDRLYRLESSRNRATGGAGLGLAICRNIVEAHGGEISAHQSQLGGLLVRVELPLEGKG